LRFHRQLVGIPAFLDTGDFMRSCLNSVSLAVALAVAAGALPPAASFAAAAVEGEAEKGIHDPLSGEESAKAPGPITFEADLAVWSLITFVVFLFVLKKFAWGPLIEGLDKRETSVLDNIAAAEAARIKAEKMLAEHAAKLEKVQDEVREIIAEARRDAEHTKNEIVAAAQKEAEATRVRAV
jgi:F-type H+-transporting ATPase subunit b